MAKKVIKAAYVALGGTDYSAYMKSAELAMEADEVDTTTFGDAGNKTYLQGLRGAKLTMETLLDADLSGLDAALYTAYNHASSNTLTFEVRADSGSVSTSNPKWTGSVIVTQYGPMLKLGEASGRSLSFTVTGAVTRATS